MQDHGKVQVNKDGFTFHVCQLRPESRGKVSLESADPMDDPAITPTTSPTDETAARCAKGSG